VSCAPGDSKRYTCRLRLKAQAAHRDPKGPAGEAEVPTLDHEHT